MGVLHLLLLAVFTVGSLTGHPSKYEKPIMEDENNLFGKKWVVLVAGSKGWNNYRHQADICHAYQIAIGNGIPKENIITMMVDDIAYNSKNPTPGKIINQPNGTDVYQGVVVDYKGFDVNSTNFLNIITGNKTAMQSIGTGKVVEGGPWDKLFINFVDHGTTGLLSFPNDYLYADQLNDALNTINANGGHKMRILLYIEACNSGSMFDGILREDTKVLAVTAAAPRESSYGCYCRAQSGPYRTCLGDEFSVTWMENLDETVYESTSKKRTVFHDYKEVRTNVTDSNVMMYGDFDVGHEKLCAFIGHQEKDDGSSVKSLSKKIKQKLTVSSRDVHSNIILHRLSDNSLTETHRQKLKTELDQNNELRFIINRVLRGIYSKVVKTRPDIKEEIGKFDQPKILNLSLDMFPCYRSILDKITQCCFSLPRNPYSLDRLTIFANMCIVDNQIHHIVKTLISESCLDVPKNIVDVF